MGPSIASTASFLTFAPAGNSSSFFPFATISLLAAFASVEASLRPSFALALTSSLGSMPLASRNLEAFVQLVQPFRW